MYMYRNPFKTPAATSKALDLRTHMQTGRYMHTLDNAESYLVNTSEIRDGGHGQPCVLLEQDKFSLKNERVLVLI